MARRPLLGRDPEFRSAVHELLKSLNLLHQNRNILKYLGYILDLEDYKRLHVRTYHVVSIVNHCITGYS